jgi:DnaJ-class molecular chaperone
MMAWLKEKEVEEKGFPCRDCQGTGWVCGFQENGKCELCNGTGRIKEMQVEVVPH